MRRRTQNPNKPQVYQSPGEGLRSHPTRLLRLDLRDTNRGIEPFGPFGSFLVLRFAPPESIAVLCVEELSALTYRSITFPVRLSFFADTPCGSTRRAQLTF